MKKILGLDLGSSSIGWAMIEENESSTRILGMGSRIIPLDTDEKDEFSKGNKISKNQKRTQRRTQRKGIDRYQLRRKALTRFLMEHEMFPEKELFELPALELWRLRARAVTGKIGLQELGRLLYHLNQKRGYKSSRSEANMDKKDTDYVAEVKNRHQLLVDSGLTIGQKFFNELQNNENYRIREQVFPREAYIDEFTAILEQQKQHYPELINEEFIDILKNEIIYYQRSLKSQKGLVSICEFEGFHTLSKEGKEVFSGPRVAPRSSPIFQYGRIWELVNTLSLNNRRGENYLLTQEEKNRVADYLTFHEKLSAAEFLKMLGKDKKEGWYFNKQIERGLQGNLTRAQLAKHLPQDSPLLRFDVRVVQTEELIYDPVSGEYFSNRQYVENSLEQEPLYRLWHTIYSISDMEECEKVLMRNFGLSRDVAANLSRIDFRKAGFGNKSAKAIRKILPYLVAGFGYDVACNFAGYNHSGSLTTEQRLKKPLAAVIPNLKKNSLRQPVVEKILNQMINLVNALIKIHGHPDEIRVELARELKQSQKERNDTFKELGKRERENDAIRKILAEHGIRGTRNNVIKYRLFREIDGDNSMLNACCVYCGKPFGFTDAMLGTTVDVEHIIPKMLLFDDSQSNKTLSHRECNAAKDNKTAFDFMQNRDLDAYIARVEKMYEQGLIGRTKRNKLLMPAAKIPKDFIERQIRETQYISRKALEILHQVCHHVHATSGSVTEYLRRLWGWDDVLMNLQLPKYRELGMTQMAEWEVNGQKQSREVIKDWSKRNDHRHHAIDALVVACTRQGYIQRINTLSSSGNRDQMYAEVNGSGKELREGLKLLDKYFILKRPLTTAQVEQHAAGILVSFKAGKKVASFGTRKIRVNGKKKVVQNGIVVPRGPLSEESVYGRIRVLQTDPATGQAVRHPLKYLFSNPHLIYKPYIKELVEHRLALHDQDVKKALASLKKSPIFLDADKTTELQYASCYSSEYVIKYPVSGLKPADVKYIVDTRIRRLVQQRFEEFIGKEKEAFKEPLYFNQEKNIKILSVRCFTGLSSVEAVKKDAQDNEIGFVKPGNNHHVAIYRDCQGQLQEHICTFWHAVERKKYGLPVIVREPEQLWNSILENTNSLPASFLEKLPSDGWNFEESIQQNEMFILGMGTDDLQAALAEENYRLLSNYLYRVQKIGSKDYTFRHHLETQVDDGKMARDTRKFYRVQSLSALLNLNPKKVWVDNLGRLIKPVEKAELPKEA